uniref:GPC1-6 n=1 Tax=Platynereis dumerilii TaxID=6359 RepID=A0A1B1M0N1_PLADU|nr:GPC1-6 [Platynereis dumerilii]
MARLQCFTDTLACSLSLAFIGLLAVARTSANEGCNVVKAAYTSKGFSWNDVPSSMISGEHLQVCPQGFTCCSQSMERHLGQQSRQEFDKTMANKIGLLRNIFVSRTGRFDVFFTELLDNAKKDLHEMFVRTYGLLYQQNSYVFTELFEDLRDYYKGKDINLLDALDNFFSVLFQKMFELLNAQYTFDQTYLQCVTEHMDDLQPFGDVPQKLSIQVKRAFIAARTFVQGLAIGRDVILEASKVQPTKECEKALLKLLYCPYCRGMANVQPCDNYCLNVMKGCLAYHSELNQDWNNYINEMLKLAERLEGPFNIESVVDPINVKISDAIMNYQENSETVSEKVFAGCGQPRLGRKKRDASRNFDDYTWNDFSKNSQRDHYSRPTTAAGTSLDRLVRDIKEKISVAKDFWKDLPHSLCNELAAPQKNENHCWNGLTRSKYMPEVMGDGLLKQNNNPEVDVNVQHPNSVIAQQGMQLKVMINKLRNAHAGHDVDWIDTADVMASGSGSGGQMDENGSGDMVVGSGGGYYENPSRGKNRNVQPNYPWMNNKDDMDFGGFNGQNNFPPVVQTRRPPASRDNYHGDGYIYDTAAAPPHHRPALTLLLVSILAAFACLWRH